MCVSPAGSSKYSLSSITKVDPVTVVYCALVPGTRYTAGKINKTHIESLITRDYKMASDNVTPLVNTRADRSLSLPKQVAKAGGIAAWNDRNPET